MAFIEFHADLQTVADKIIEAGEDEFCEFMDHIADAILERYGKQFPKSRERFEIFISRMHDNFGSETKVLLQLLYMKQPI